jgi:hypothetical protein
MNVYIQKSGDKESAYILKLNFEINRMTYFTDDVKTVRRSLAACVSNVNK